MHKKIVGVGALALASMIMVIFAACGSAPAATPVPTASPKANIAIEGAWARPAAMVIQEHGGMGSMDGMSSTGSMDNMGDMPMNHGGTGTGAVYFKMSNTGDASDTLVEVLDARVNAPGDVAGVIELHETKMTDGIMAMQKVSGIEVPAGGTTELKPGSFHVMILDIKRNLVPGDRITLDVRFQSGTEKTIVAEVREP
jgi:copper(I)-binding protein